jgi:hypothetical protein
MNNAKDIIAITKYVASEAAHLDDVVDNTLAPIKDYTDTLGDVVAPIRALSSFYNLARRMKLKGFLRKYAERIRTDCTVGELVPKLEKYLAKLKNVELIAQTIDQAVAAKSVRCSCILGFFAGDIIANSTDASYKDSLVINGLSNLIDEDIDNFVALYEHLSKKKRNKDLRIYDMKEELMPLKIDPFQLELTVEKLKAVLLLGFDVGGYGNVGNAWGAFTFNENSDYFYSLVKKCGI